MDIKAKIEEIVEKVKGDDQLMERIKQDPINTVEELVGMDLPDEQIMAIVEGIKAKLSLDSIKDGIGGIFKGFGK